MIEPDSFDDGYYSGLGLQDKKDFDKLYKKKYKSIDEDRARESFEQSFDSNEEAEYRLFRDVVNAFSSPQAGFEATIVNPLYEFGEPEVEILLAKPQSSSVHLCFISCEISGQDYIRWQERINSVSELMDNQQIVETIKNNANCSNLRLGSIQFVTLTQDIDIVDADVDILKRGIDPEYYAIWKLIRSAEYNEETEEMEEAKTIKLHDGSTSVPSLETIVSGGIDPTTAENDDIKYCFSSHPVFPIGEVCLELYLNKYNTSENPKEFNRSEFESAYLNNVHFGDDRESMTTIAEDRVDDLLEFSLSHGIIKKDDDIVEQRDFKIMWSSEDPGDIKSMVQNKYIDSKVPERTGQIAYDRTKEEHEKGEASLDDFAN
ncbi:hypothetical protein [Haloarcula hispanica]|nr:hypothetical protein [Haloarcula hispanica]QRG24216.1 hypothetical protein HarHp1_100 [Haloarcula virus Harhisp1]